MSYSFYGSASSTLPDICSYELDLDFENGETIFKNFDLCDPVPTPCDINKTQLYDVLLPINRDYESVDGRVVDSMDKICINVCNEFSIDINGDSYKYDGEYTLIGVTTTYDGYNDYTEYLVELCGNSFAAKNLKSRYTRTGDTPSDIAILAFYSKDLDAILEFDINNEEIVYYGLTSRICTDAPDAEADIESNDLDLDFENGETIFKKFDLCDPVPTPCDINKNRINDVLLPIYRDNDSVDGRVIDSMDKICN